MIKIIKNDLIYYQFNKWGIPNCFTTKHGGVSTGPPSTMNLDTTKDTKENVLKNYQIICNSIGTDFNSLTGIMQTHSSNVVVATSSEIGNVIHHKDKFGPADAIITNDPSLTLVTTHADCLPLYFYDPVTNCIALAHAGWRGTVSLIAKKTVEQLKKTFGVQPKNLLAGIGPGIGACCFEVDSPVKDQFINITNINEYITNFGQKYKISLSSVNYTILQQSGINKSNITITNVCTKCNGNIFHSHRLSGSSRGSMVAMLRLG